MTAHIVKGFTSGFVFERAAAGGLATQARERQYDLQNAANDLVQALRDLHALGVTVEDTESWLRGMHDAITNCDAGLMKDIDDAGDHANSVDLSGVDALLEKLKD